MAMIKYLATALSVAATAYAASCSTSATMTVQNGGDASAIGSCTTFSGSIAVATGGGSTVDFGDVEDITGSLNYAGDSTVQTINANSLKSLGGLNLTGLSQLSSLNMGSLQQVGDMSLVQLGTLSSFNFGTGVQKAGVVTIIDTQVSDISAISQASQIEGLSISDNGRLSNITFNLEKLGSADIGPNNNVLGMNLMFPKLATAESLTFRNASTVSTPSLGNVSNALGIYGGKMQSYSAPNLTTVGALVVNDNSELTNLSFPMLANISSQNNGTLQVANNTKLLDIDGFANLVMVSGNVDFSGVFNNLSLNDLKTVTGALSVDTSSKSFQCGPINNLAGSSSQVVSGQVNCTSGDNDPSSTSGNGGSGTGSGSAATSSGAAIPLDVPTFATGAGLFGGILALLM